MTASKRSSRTIISISSRASRGIVVPRAAAAVRRPCHTPNGNLTRRCSTLGGRSRMPCSTALTLTLCGVRPSARAMLTPPWPTPAISRNFSISAAVKRRISLPHEPAAAGPTPSRRTTTFYPSGCAARCGRKFVPANFPRVPGFWKDRPPYFKSPRETDWCRSTDRRRSFRRRRCARPPAALRRAAAAPL